MSLSSAEAEDRLAAYRQLTVNHPKLAEVDRQVSAAIVEKAGSSHLLVYGPSGVGKSTMMRHIQARLTDSVRQQGMVPIVRVEARPSDTGDFNRIDYYRQVLAALGEHVVVKQILVNVNDTKGGRGTKAGIDALELRDAMEQALRRMQVRAVIIDEAQLLMKVEKPNRLLDQLEWLKSMTNMTDTLHILVGTYDLLDFRNLSGQAARRGRDIHFARYRFDDEADRTAFQASAKFLLENAPVAINVTDLLSHWQALYERSIGCIGVLKDWLVEAVAAALAVPHPQLTWDVIQSHAPTVARSIRMGADARAGEQHLEQSDRSEGDLRALLGMPQAAPPTPTALPPPDAAEAKPKRRGGRQSKKAAGDA